MLALPDCTTTVGSSALWNTKARRSACGFPEERLSMAPLAASYMRH